MTAAQSPKIFEVLGKHFHNTEDARIVVTKIEQIIESKIADKKDALASKDDISGLESKIAETKIDVIKWVFPFFAALAVMIIGIYLKK